MTHAEFLSQTSGILELDTDVLTGEERLEDLDEWNSLAMISFIAFADEHFSKTLSPRLFSSCSTVNDLGKLVGVEPPTA